MTDRSPFSRFQDLLSDIFQFETGDLDFGIYRILNAKRKQVEAFITHDLHAVVDQAFGQYAATKTAVVAVDLEAERAKIIAAFGAAALDATGQLVMYQATPLGQAYLVMEKAAATSTTTDSLKAKVYNDLLTFFSRYYDEGDFLPLRRAGRDMTYAIPYNGEEVTLYWANKGQYYIKTDDRLAAYRFRVGAFHIALEVQAAQTEQNNNKGAKRYYLLAPDDNGSSDVKYNADTSTLHIYFVQRPLSETEEKEFGKTENQRPQDKLNASTVASVLATVLEPALRDALAAPYAPKEGEPAPSGALPTLLRHLSQFTKKNTADFFIHKNLSGFLRGELDQFIKTECLKLDELLNGGEGDYALQTARARATKQVGDKIITLLAQVEDFQRRLFEKRKFVLRTDYVFTLDRVPVLLHPAVLANATQVQEWRCLYDVDRLLTSDKLLGEGGLTMAALENEPYRRLPVDTRHFDSTFTAALLGSVEDLDALTDGVLFNSENFQALNLMTETYRERVKCIYIDPPYNTAASEILYKNEYKNSSWLSLMNDRLTSSRLLLRPDGLLCVTIDDFELYRLQILLDQTFGDSNYLATAPIRNNPSGRSTVKGFSINHEYALFYAKDYDAVKVGRFPHNDKQTGRYSLVDDEGHPHEWENFRKSSAESDRQDRPKQFYPLFFDPAAESLRLPENLRVAAEADRLDDEWDDAKKAWNTFDAPKDGEFILLPMQGDRAKVWRFGIKRTADELFSMMVRQQDAKWEIYTKKFLNMQGSLPRTWWDSPSYSARDNGTRMLVNLFGAESGFDFPKSIAAVTDTIRIGIADTQAPIVLDFFGGSGTTGQAVIDMNRAKKSDGELDRLKYILVEMGTYFDTVLLPRQKKAAFASGWRDGKPTSRDAVSQTIKYHTLEQYEDTLNNLQLRPKAESQQALDMFGNDYLLRYMLDFDTVGSPSLLNVATLADPFDYTLRVKSGDDFVHQAVDLPETFSYLLGLRVRKIRSYTDAGREYRAVLGDKDGVKIAHIWRKSSDLVEDAAALARDAAFMADTVLLAMAETRPDRVYVNGAFTLAYAVNCEPELSRLMFAPVGA